MLTYCKCDWIIFRVLVVLLHSALLKPIVIFWLAGLHNEYIRKLISQFIFFERNARRWTLKGIRCA